MPILGAQGSGAKSAPVAPTIGTATDVGTSRAYNNGAATVTFTAPFSKLPISSYTVTSSPGGFTGTGSSSPITVTGLQSSTAYTFTVTATSTAGTSAASSASNSITATTVPQTPTITSVTRSSNTAVSIAFTGATGGSVLTAVTATSSPSVSITSSGTSSPMTATATYTTGQAYTFTITATNANGTSSASSVSSSVTPFPTPVLSSWTADTAYPASDNRIVVAVGGLMTNANAPQFWAGSGYDVNGNPALAGRNFSSGSWSTANLPLGSFGLGASRISGTSAAGPRGEVGSQFFIYNGLSWSSGANTYPVSSTPWIGTAAMSGGIRYAAGQNEQRSWSQTDANSTFTAQTSYPFNTQLSAVDNGTFNGNMYTFNQTAGPTTMYYATSLSSGWTAGAAQPATSGNIPQSTTDNTNIIVSWKNVNAMYAFNKSNNTFTSIGTPPTTGFYAQTYSKDGLLRSVQKTTANVAGTHHYASYA